MSISRRLLLLFPLAMILSSFLIKASDNSDNSVDSAYEHKESEYEGTWGKKTKGDTYNNNRNNNNNNSEDNNDEPGLSGFVSNISTMLISNQHSNQEKVKQGIGLSLSKYKKNVLLLATFSKELNQHLNNRSKVEEDIDKFIEKNQDSIEDKLDELEGDKQGKRVSTKDKNLIKKKIRLLNRQMKKYVKNEWSFMTKMSQKMMEKNLKSSLAFANMEKRNLATYGNLTLIMKDRNIESEKKMYKEMYKDISNIHNKNKNDREKYKESQKKEMQNLNNQFKRIEEEMALKIQEAKDEKKKLEKEYEIKYGDKIKSLNDTIKKLKKKVNDLNIENTDYSNTINDLKQDKKTLQEKIKKCQEKSKELNNIKAVKIEIVESAKGAFPLIKSFEPVNREIAIRVKDRNLSKPCRRPNKAIDSITVTLDKNIADFIQDPFKEDNTNQIISIN